MSGSNTAMWNNVFQFATVVVQGITANINNANRNNAYDTINNITKHQAEQGGTYAASRDVYISVTDRDNGYTEVLVAKEGDHLEVLEMDAQAPGQVRVRNTETGDIITVTLNDMEDI